MSNRGWIDFAARIALAAGAAGSVGMMLRVGHRNEASIPGILVAFFTGWVASPFIALALADSVASRWAAPTRSALRALILIVPVASLLIYGYVASSPPRPKPAAVFLLVPLGSWVLMAILITVAASVARGRSRRGAGA